MMLILKRYLLWGNDTPKFLLIFFIIGCFYLLILAIDFVKRKLKRK
jgi:hypothetical protein